jgi:hypothetical protein
MTDEKSVARGATRGEVESSRTAATDTGHTPGPWRWHGYYLLQDVLARDGGEGRETNPYSTPCGYPIADDGSAGGEYNSLIDIDSPDARLIAAAPDLLDALKTLIGIDAVRFADDKGPPGEGWQSNELVTAWGNAEAAIAKAEGR